MTFDLITGKTRDLGGFTVSRILPSATHRAVGPFVFFDLLGPAVITEGDGVQVRPHPHIGLATVTYLFEGELMHRDSLGSTQPIHPGDVNWMTSGRGIVHSERSPLPEPGRPLRMHGIQSWVALPRADEDANPAFSHHPASTLPTRTGDGVTMTVIAGEAFGMRSPAPVRSPTLYVAVEMAPGASLVLDDAYDERAVFVVHGDVACAGETLTPEGLAVFAPGGEIVLEARGKALLMLVGGARLDGPRALDWNFVASDRSDIARAQQDWLGYPNARFPQVPGESDFIPLPGVPKPEPTAL